jgi:hypothetical protein
VSGDISTRSCVLSQTFISFASSWLNRLQDQLSYRALISLKSDYFFLLLVARAGPLSAEALFFSDSTLFAVLATRFARLLAVGAVARA